MTDEKNLAAMIATSLTSPLEFAEPGPTSNSKSPLLIGVAGHRDLREVDMAAIDREVRCVFAELRGKYPHTPLAVISPLADGADRVVASIAKKEGAALIVPLSWPAGVYDEQLHRTGDRKGFDELLAKADRAIPMPLIEGVSHTDIRTSESARENQYSQAGAYVARHSQILIALWDGEERKESGTARVVAWHEGGEKAPFAPTVGRLDELESGPVYHIRTPRSNVATHIECVERTIRYPAGYEDEASAAAAFDAMWSHVDRFNADVSQQGPAFERRIETSKDWLIPREKRGTLPEDIAELLDRYACTDAAAMQFQKHTYATLKGVFVLVALAVVCFEFYTHLLVEWWPLLVIYLGFLLTSMGWYVRSSSSFTQAKYLDYRSLAEALRVQLFWRLAGLEESVADFYLRNLRTELDWIRQSVRSVNLVSGLHATGAAPSHEEQIVRLKMVREHWIDAQLKYFTTSGPRNERFHWRCSQLSRWFFWLAIGLGMLLLAVHLKTHHLHHPLVILVFLCTATAALCHEYGEKQAFAIHSKRYDWMRSFFTTGKRHIDDLIEAGNVSESRGLILELGREALQENAEWLLQHRQRPIKPPAV